MASACSNRRRSLAFSRLALASSAASGFSGAGIGPRLCGVKASSAPASRCRRQSVSADEYSPSRRNSAAMPIPPVSAARSVSSRIRSFSLAEKVRRFGRDVSSGAEAAGAATVVGLWPSSASAPAASDDLSIFAGMTTRSFSCARKGNLSGGNCLTLIGTVGKGQRPGATSDEQARIKALERENRELRQANEILRKASAYFAMAELDRRSKP
jgi:hypothetical protein